MARRKKRRFGSPPAEHRERAAHWIKSARKAAQGAARALRDDDCRNAFHRLVDAQRYQARSASERIGAGVHISPGAKMRKLYHRFMGKCLK